MRSDRLTLLLFVVYCFEVGIFLTGVPWTLFWDRTLGQMPLEPLRTLALEPVVRAAVSGFGLVHLLWGVHDLVLILRPSPEPPAPSDP